MRLDDLTPIEKRIITTVRQMTKGLVTIPVADGRIQEPEVKMLVKDIENFILDKR